MPYIKKEIEDKFCLYCHNIFKPVRNDRHLKYCSKICRERDWRQKNPKRSEELRKRGYKKYKINNPIYCSYCNKEIPMNERKPGKTMCSIECVKKKKKRDAKKYRDIYFLNLKNFKEKQGCSICGYNKYGGSIDFHHKNPDEKDMRITAAEFYFETNKIKIEINKCILVCKNCHNELHDIMRKDLDKYNLIIKGIDEDKKRKENGDVYL